MFCEDTFYTAEGRTLDPNGYWAAKEISEDKLKAALGYLPGFIMPREGQTIKDQLEANFNGIICWMDFDSKASFEAGVFKYQGDPDYQPLWKIEHLDNVMYQYKHGLVVLIDASTNKMQWARID